MSCRHRQVGLRLEKAHLAFGIQNSSNYDHAILNLKSFESLDHAPWTKSLEWASLSRDFVVVVVVVFKKDRSFDNILLKSARLLFIEEAQHFNDVKRYDMFNRTLHQIGQSTSSRFVIYSLEVPGCTERLSSNSGRRCRSVSSQGG